MLPSSAIQVLESTPTRLHIYCPPNFGLAVVWMVGSFVCALLYLWLGHQQGKKLGFWWLMPVGAACVGIFLISTFGNVVLSTANNSFMMSERYLFIIRSEHALPLKDLQEAVVETNEGGTHLLNFVFRSGPEVPLGLGFMNRDGYYQAANAVNNFIAMAASNGAGGASVNDGKPEAIRKMEEEMEKDDAKAADSSADAKSHKNSKPGNQ